jgi:hypothetical protein
MIPSMTGADFSKLEPTCGGSWPLTTEPEGLRWKYHLRSQSGSNGPIAKETSPLLGWRPILSFRAFPLTRITHRDVGLPRLRVPRRRGKPRLYDAVEKI